MKIDEILKTYDEMFGVESLETIEDYLVKHMNEASDTNELGALFTLLNEMIGFCRDTTQTTKGLLYCEELLSVLDKLNIEGGVEYATCLLNVANAYRAFGKFNLSEDLFTKCEEIYIEKLDACDFGFANLYNNWALLKQELNDYEKSSILLKKALKIVLSYPEDSIKEAITRSNLGASLLQENCVNEAKIELIKAFNIFEEEGGNDYHFYACLVSLGDVYHHLNEMPKALLYLHRALIEIEKHVGRNDNFQKILEKYNDIKNRMEPKTNLEMSNLFYQELGKTMISRQFKDYEHKIAVGLVGEGSDCFGFDDDISADHDYDVGFCLWLTQEDYDLIGKDLQTAYQQLAGHSKESRLAKRRGVFTIDEFYYNMLGRHDFLLSEIEEERLSLGTNGQIFRDDLGLFTSIRQQLNKYYDYSLWLEKIAIEVHDFSQYAQSNYPRMMARKDAVTSQLCISKAIESALHLVYLLEKRYRPYYKWLKRGAEQLPLGQQILPLVEKIIRLPVQEDAWKEVVYNASVLNEKDQCVILFEEMASIFLKELKKQHLVEGSQLFLECYVEDIKNGTYLEKVEIIVQMEWQQFDQVQNVGGRASCQNDFPTFSIMRKSQYMTWPTELLDSYIQDLMDANQRGWNLITEKYARMMKSTSKEEYEKIEKHLPVLDEPRIAIQEQIIQIQVAWMEEFTSLYPKMAGNARVVHSQQDQSDDTSYETYLRGEISTYSEKTILLYGKFIVDCVNKEKNLAFEIMNNTAHLYGYSSLEEAEKSL